MKCPPQRLAATGLLTLALFSGAAFGQGIGDLRVPSLPDNLQVPSGNVAYLKGNASGTQNYMCVPGANGPTWQFAGPQATLFVAVPWSRLENSLQITTHFLSPNPAEAGTPRPTWQSSFDTSAVWGKALAESRDPRYVEAGAIPWLLVQITGAQRGPLGGSTLSSTTFIHRVKTSGGVAPATGCDASSYGKMALVPYTTDYIFYRAGRD